ncbi:MAG: lactonase family protein [Verrucomicrobiia bacterium]
MSSLVISPSASPLAADRGADTSGTQTLVYFGTYSSPKSKGVYVSKLDKQSGRLTSPELAGEVASPSFLALHPSRPLLYAVNEAGRIGGVSAFSMDRASGKLTLLNQQSSGGGAPCHLNVDATGKFVLIANYTGGSCAVFPIEADGRLAPSSAFVQHRGSSVNPQRQSAPHAHGIYLDPQNQFAFVPDLGLDKVLIYKFDAARGLLEPNDPAFGEVPPGSGPRHLALHPNGKRAYVINEMLCTITVFACDLQRGSLAPGQTVSALRLGEIVKPNWSTAEIEVHPSGKFVYGSNRGHDTLAAFSIDPATGNLTLVQHVATGKTPRGFGIDPSGRFLIVGGQDDDSVSVLRIDTETGRLSPTGQTVEVGKPVCVKFYSN